MHQILRNTRRDFLKDTSSVVALALASTPISLVGQNVSNSNPARGYAARSVGGPLVPISFDRRALRADDVKVEILYCGVCHSDIHEVRGEWGPKPLPLVPGHEIAGRVTAVGSNVMRFKVGDHVGVGFISDSCGTCESCRSGHEQYCDNNGAVWTSGGSDKYLGGATQGGYSSYIVTKEHFVVRIPSALDLKVAAPLLCAGVTTYSAMLTQKVGRGTKIGVAGIGGLGHLAIKIASARGAEVVAFTTTPSKSDDAIRFGASEVVVVDDVQKLTKYQRHLDFLVSTIPAQFDIASYAGMVKRDGTMTQIGIPPTGAMPMNIAKLSASRVNINSHFVGGMAETQSILDFCAEHRITPEVEVVNIRTINDVFNMVVAKEARYRYVIDMGSLA
jgi:uncharacterized zinc-type alcohol dehydrogenase-like protein